MRVSLKWLQEYVNITVPAEELAHRLTMAGLAVEAVEKPGEGIDKVYTGKILTVEPHPNADRLSICQVTLGQGDNIQIVTGATNVAGGHVVPVAVEGARLAGGLVIKKSKLRGVESRGMLCSGQELGLDTSIMPLDQAHGIMLFNPATPLGLDVKTVIGLDDVILELELTPNRGDCMSMLGVAREVAVLLGEELRLPQTGVDESGPDVQGMVTIDIDDPGLCSRYVARLFRNIKIGPSPSWMQERLRAAGIRPISNLVDITNYVMMELGQPLHAFDFDALREGRIIVRRGREDETMVSLDGNERRLSGDMLVIADPGGPVAVAGVMGGLATEVTENTVNVLLESAHFNPVSIRRTSRALGLRSESSSRFEKGVDVTGCLRAADRAARLLLDMAAGEVAQGAADNYPARPAPKTVMIRPERVDHVLGVQVDRQDIVSILSSLEFQVKEKDNDLLVTVPGHRADVSLEEDLIEEVARIFGYNRIPYTLPYGSSTRGARTPRQAFEVHVKNCLASLGLDEVVTYSFTGPSTLDRAALPPESSLRNVIHLQNPLSEEQSVMRTMMLPGILEVLQRNASRRINDLAVFEVGKVFLPSRPGPLPHEKQFLAAAAMGSSVAGWNTKGQPYDYYYIKGVLETLLDRMGIKGYTLDRETGNSLFHPGKAARVAVGENLIGVIGEIHPDVMENYNLPKSAVGMEIDFEMLLRLAGQARKYRPLPRFPGIERDLALVVRQDISARDITRVIKKFGGQFLQEIKLFDVYRGDQVKEGLQSMAFSLKFQAEDRTLTDQEINGFVTEVAQALAGQLGAELRG
ncbi:MAG: phenylalanyl-tRNA synthetase subunit beta [Peptococcaceae bacterium BRH_c4a]|nr:MAG: phenylalanyl-tRNA synthetase subunit beta [Peptococcaceae bacterium BRH_c4a]